MWLWIRQFLAMYKKWDKSNCNKHSILQMISEHITYSVMKLKFRYTANAVTQLQSYRFFHWVKRIEKKKKKWFQFLLKGLTAVCLFCVPASLLCNVVSIFITLLYINQYCVIGCGYPSFFVYCEHGYLNLALQTGGVFLHNI